MFRDVKKKNNRQCSLDLWLLHVAKYHNYRWTTIFSFFLLDHPRQQSKGRRIQNKMKVEEGVMNFIDYDIDHDLELDDKDLGTFSEYENCEVEIPDDILFDYDIR